MPVYEYKALDGSAKNCTGVIDAETPRDAREKLRVRKIYVTALSPITSKEPQPAQDKGKLSFSLAKLLPRFDFGQGRRNAAVGQFIRQLSTLLSSGIPMAQALTALVEQTEEKEMQTVVRDVREKITGGIDFGDALADHPRYFSPLLRSMVKAGEASGKLDEVLSRAADFMQNQTRLRNKIITAMTYPAIMLVICTGVVIALMSLVVPKITAMLVKQRIPMPLPTKIVSGASDFIVHQWYIVLVLLLIAMAVFRTWVSTTEGRYRWDRLKLRAPVVGSVLSKSAIARFSTTLAVLLRSGLPALEGLRIVKDVVGNVALSKVIGEIHDSIIEGTDISTPVRKSGFFPPMVGYMIGVGEQTGELESLLDRIAAAYEEEVDIAVLRMTAMVEPLMIVFMAGIVGLIIAAVMFPMISLSTQAR